MLKNVPKVKENIFKPVKNQLAIVFQARLFQTSCQPANHQ
jgi:hypothetical protein